MGTKAEIQGVVVSGKMDQSVVVAVERRVRHGLYGKIQRRTSKFMAHDPGNDAKEGDVVAIVETRKGIENVEGITATDGLDGIWIGHFDLSTSLGIPGQFDHPDLIAAEDRVRRACTRHKKSFGCLVMNVERGIGAYHAGYDMICYSGDVWLLQETLRRGIDDVKAALGGRRQG